MKQLVRFAAFIAMIVTANQSAADGDCGITFAANHQAEDRFESDTRSRSHLSIDLLRSQYRIENEPWRSAQELCSVDRLDLADGESAAMLCRADLACGAYQFLFRIDSRRSNGELIETRLIAFPTNSDAVEVSRPRTVQLGNLRQLFDAQEATNGPRRRAAQALN
ncbi:MAG: hypothetical protein ACREV5_18510 [Steroidobacter sp.]